MNVPEVAFRAVAPRDVPMALAARAFDTAAHTQHYLGALDGKDVVLLTLDVLPSEFLITEIFVDRTERGRRYGSAALAFAESVARAKGRGEMKLQPQPIDDREVPRDALVAWYERAGFVALDAERLVWTKRILRAAE